jgi:hypothetical protein
MISVPTLSLRRHQNGAEARVACSHMSFDDRLAVLKGALKALVTGRFQLWMPHVRTLHQGHQVELAYKRCGDPQAG